MSAIESTETAEEKSRGEGRQARSQWKEWNTNSSCIYKACDCFGVYANERDKLNQ